MQYCCKGAVLKLVQVGNSWGVWAFWFVFLAVKKLSCVLKDLKLLDENEECCTLGVCKGTNSHLMFH